MSGGTSGPRITCPGGHLVRGDILSSDTALSRISMASPPSKEQKIEEGKTKTVLFVVGHSPYKGTLSLSRQNVFSFEEIKEAVGRQGKPQIPYPGEGQFKVVASTTEQQVVVFRYRKTIGCSKLSDSRNLLPVPVCRHRKIETLMQTPTNIRVGSRFLYNGYDQQYTIDGNGDMLTRVVCFPAPNNFQCENSRSYQMIEGLKLALGQHYSVEWWFGNYNRHCPFSGGGDLSIFKSCSPSAVVVDLHSNDGTEQTTSNDGTDDESTPDDVTRDISLGTKLDTRDISLGTKVSPTNKIANSLGSGVDQEGITLQLQANMLLLSSTLLLNKVKEDPDKAGGINILSCYGLQIGLNCPLKILKLSVDFSKKELEYEELLNVSPTPVHHLYVDMALQHVVSCL